MPYPTRPEQIRVIDRTEFLERYWDHRPGQHVTIIGFSGAGKTTLGMQLLKSCASTRHKALTLAFKPQDDTVIDWANQLGHPIVQSYPLPRAQTMFQRHEPTGYVVWPQPPIGDDPDEYEHELATTFNQTIRYAYAHMHRGRSVPYKLFADEAVELGELEQELPAGPRGKRKVLPVDRWMNAVYARGRSLGVSMWTSTQRPAGLNLKAYSGAIHLFLAQETDARNRKRFDEIGGIDSGLVSATVRRLQPYHWLYMRRTDRTLCIIGP